MSESQNSCTKIRVGNLVCDAVPDPPRTPNTFDNQGINEKLGSNEPPNVNLEPNPSTTKSTGNSNARYSRPKKKTKTPNTNATVNNWNIVKCSNIKIGPTTKYVYNNFKDQKQATSAEENKEFKLMLPHVQTLSSSELKMSKDDVFIIKTHIGKNWKNFAQKIGYSSGQVDQFLMDHERKGIGEVVYQILIDWVQAFTSDATVGRAVCALWSCKEYDCIEKLASAHNLL